jgi:hypothetical protein
LWRWAKASMPTGCAPRLLTERAGREQKVCVYVCVKGRTGGDACVKQVYVRRAEGATRERGRGGFWPCVRESRGGRRSREGGFWLNDEGGRARCTDQNAAQRSAQSDATFEGEEAGPTERKQGQRGVQTGFLPRK